MTAPRIRVREIAIFERPVVLRLPFRFGVTTLRHCPQAFVKVRIAIEGGGDATGCAAELIAPKWFDKSPVLSDAETIEQLRTALRLAGSAYIAIGPSTAFGLFCERYAGQIAAGAAAELPPLAAGYGQALIDRAIFDAVCRAHGIPFEMAIRENLPGVSADLTADLSGFDFNRFLSNRDPLAVVSARHTVGMVDPLTADDQAPEDCAGDGLPETLDAVIEVYGIRHFKIKIGGDIDEDHDRLVRVAHCLDQINGNYVASVDGNEQYHDSEGVLALLARLDREPAPAVARLLQSTAYIEQPITRDVSAAVSVDGIAARTPVIIDESDGTIEAFPLHRSLGYTGVSSKTCKGFYKSILNAARCIRWNHEIGIGGYFMSGEDLSCQAGLAVQQDLALVSTLGITHVERNGHHYVYGMSAAPMAEQARFLSGFAALYETRGGVVCLKIRDGRMDTGCLHDTSGWASTVEPDWGCMQQTMCFTA